MSSPGAFGGNAGKKAVHVKWAGKTIALGTFPASEADEKCARAKALTRAWRSTMRPKPSRDWVMLELERLGVRVVSGRLGRKTGEEGEEEKKVGQSTPMGMSGASSSSGWAGDADLGSLIGNRRPSMGISSMMNDGRRNSLGSIGQMVGLEGGDTLGHQALGGGFNLGDAQRRSSGLAGLGNLAGSSLGTMGMSVNPNQHYEMLKLHHMNLLNEIQETTLMMNLYQQQQLHQQQQQLQQQASAEGLVGGDHQQQLGLMHAQQNGLDPTGMFGAAQQLSQQQRASLGLGVSQMGGMTSNQLGSSLGFGSPQPAPPQQQQQLSQQQLPPMEVNPPAVNPPMRSSGSTEDASSSKADSADEADEPEETPKEPESNELLPNKRSIDELAAEGPEMKKVKTTNDDLATENKPESSNHVKQEAECQSTTGDVVAGPEPTEAV